MVVALIAASLVAAGAAWAAAPDQTAPPTVVPGAARVTVSFAPPSDGGSPITGYTANCTSSDGGAPGSSTGPNSPITVTNLTNGNTYTCTVTASNADGDGLASPPSPAVVPSTVPQAPAQPLTTAGDRNITVSFAAPSDGGSPITGYTANCTSSDGGAPGSSTGPNSPITVTNLTNGNTYTCTVTATNADGDGAPSAASDTTVPHSVPDAPAQPTVVAGNASITVTFAAPPDNGRTITGFAVSCTSSDGGAPGTQSATGSPIVVGGLSNGKTYTCSVTASNGDGDSNASPASDAVMPHSVPDAPASPTATAGDGQIALTFAAPFDGGSAITGYNAACASGNGGTAGSATQVASPVTVGGLTNGKTYTCTVTATNADGEGPPSSPSGAAIPHTVPDQLEQPSATPGNGAITLTFNEPNDGGTAITGYTAQCDSSNGGTSGSNSAPGSPIDVGGLSNGKTYTCTIVATNGDGNSPASPATVPTIPHTVPDAPAQPGVTPGNARITVAFVAPFDGGAPISSYRVECDSINGGAPNTETGTSSPVTVTSLTNGKTYLCNVIAINNDGESGASLVSEAAVPSTVPARIARPSIRAGNAKITVAFSAPFNGGKPITGYRVSCTSSNGGVAASNDRSTSPIVVTGLTNGRSYTCTVRARNANGFGSASHQSSTALPWTRGYRLFAGDGGVFTFGEPRFYGSAVGKTSATVIAMIATRDNGGYWLVTENGAVFSFGNAHFYGAAFRRTMAPIVGAARTPSGRGYWLVASTGTVYAFGDAHNYGSNHRRLAAPIVSISSSRTGRGYWLVGADGGVFTFGDADFYGAATGKSRARVVGMARTPSGRGYWLASADGNVFVFGDARAYGHVTATSLRMGIVGITATRTGRGYWLAAGDGGVFAYGDAPFVGWVGSLTLRRTIRGASQ